MERLRSGDSAEVRKIDAETVRPPAKVMKSSWAEGVRASEDVELKAAKMSPGDGTPDGPSREAQAADQAFAFLMW